MGTKAVIYVRYSSENQREVSLEDQLRLCRERLVKEGWTLVQVFRDAAMSGASAYRPGYQALLEGVREAAFDVVVAEALDRVSRDQEDVAALFKRLRFAGIRLVTLAEGEINELHVGLKGTMNALFLRDLAAKTHRGLRGRVEAGRSGGGNAYGYRVVRQIGADGIPSTGERAINLDEAEVVIRIFRAYAAGESPRRIALALNAERISGPRGGTWSSSTINGNRTRGTGILNNELYIGRLIWNRLGYHKDPETGRRRSRQHAVDKHITIEVPALRIVDQDLWIAVKARQRDLDQQQGHPDGAPSPFWSQQRPRYLFSGLMRCGVCGAGFSKISASHFGCSGARNKGPTVCTNRLGIRRDVLEATVLDGLRTRLMDPDIFKMFVTEFTEEWNRLQSAAAGTRSGREAELQRVQRQIDRLVDAVADGTMPAASIKDRLRSLEQSKEALTSELASTPVPAPRLHPKLADIYRERIADLAEVLGQDDTTVAREAVRSLVDTIVLVPEDGRLRVEVRGELAAILALATAATGRQGGMSASVASGLSAQMKLVAGERFGHERKAAQERRSIRESWASTAVVAGRRTKRRFIHVAWDIGPKPAAP